MANYANLKATINANIKANGTEAITGPVLNSVLTAAVNTLGAGYQFMGVATTSTNPGTPDANVFYIAATPGTYTNFGGKTVADGEVAILKYNGSWTKEVTGAATAAQLTQLGQKVNELVDAVGVVSFPVISGSTIDAIGRIFSQTGSQRSDYIDLTGISTLYITNPNNATAEFNCFYDSNKDFIAGSRTNIPANTAFYEVSVPTGAAYLILSVRNNGEMLTAFVDGAAAGVSELKAEIANCVKFISQTLSDSQKAQARTNIGAANYSTETGLAKFTGGEYISSGSINDINTPGGYNLAAAVTDKPVASHAAYLLVVAGTSRFIQKYLFDTADQKLYFGAYDKTGGSMSVPWIIINKTPLASSGSSTTDAMSQKAVTDFVQKPNLPNISTGSVNDLKLAGGGYWVQASVADLPAAVQGSLIVNPTFNNGRFLHKKYMNTAGDIYEQIADSTNPSTPFVPWLLTNPRANIATYGKNVVCFGDSIFGNYHSEDDITGGVVHFIGKYGYGTTKNVAFGGTSAALRGHTTYWNDLSFVSLVDAIVSGDWTAQDNAIAQSTEFLDYFASHLATLKAIDWSTIDIVTIAYGANDFAADIALGDKSSNKNNFTGALVYGISELLEEYPHLKVVLLSPCWRWYKDGSGYYDYDSDTEQNALNLKVTDYVTASLETADVLHIPGCDNYYKLGINRYDYSNYFKTGVNADGAHHDIEGRKKLAHRIVAFLNANL